jgi:hypothetical protein
MSDMTENVWLIEEGVLPDKRTLQEIERGMVVSPYSILGKKWRVAQEVPNLAVLLQDITIWDNKKWFGEADIRLDALVVHGNVVEGEPQSFYHPRTVPFSRVADGDQLPVDEGGLLVFYGKPLYFLDIFLTVSRDRKDSDDLATLLLNRLQEEKVHGAIAVLLGLAVATPTGATVTAALGAAAVLGEVAYEVLRQATGTTVGLYRASWLQHHHDFGIGRHPPEGTHRMKDLSFWYEIAPDKPSVDPIS